MLIGKSQTYYELRDNDVEVKNGVITICTYPADNSQRYSISIPDTLDNQRVIGIGPRLFYQRALQNIELPASLQIIGASAFSYSALERIVIPNNVSYIGWDAFERADYLKETPRLPSPAGSKGWIDAAGRIHRNGDIIPQYLSLYIADMQDTLSNEDVVVEGGVIVECTSPLPIKKIVIPDSLDQQRIIGIGPNVFERKDLLEVELPAFLRFIKEEAFYDNRMSTINIPDSVRVIGTRAFHRGLLQSVSLGKNLEIIDKEAFDGNRINDCLLPNSLMYIGRKAFEGNSGFKLTLPNSGNLWVGGSSTYSGGTQISNFRQPYAVLDTHVLRSDEVVVENGVMLSCSYSLSASVLVMPDTLDGFAVKEIKGYEKEEEGVFFEKNFLSIVLPNTLEKIGKHAFWLVPLGSLSLPNSVVYIETYAFTSVGGEHTYILPSPEGLVRWSGTVFNGNRGQRDIEYVAEIDRLKLNPTQSIPFGEIAVRTSKSESIQLQNNTSSTMTVNISLSSGSPFFIDGKQSLQKTIPPNGSVSLSILYSPTKSNNDTAKLTIAELIESDTLLLTGFARERTITLLSPSEVNLGTIGLGQSKTDTIKIKNEGSDTLSITKISLPVGVTSVPQWSGGTIAPNFTKTLVISLTTNYEGSYRGKVEIFSNGTNEQQTTVSLLANGEVVNKKMTLSSDIHWGEINVNSSTKSNLVVSNEGNVPLQILEVTSSESVFTINENLPLRIEPNSSYVLPVTFTPVQEIDYTGTITVKSDVPSTKSLKLSGRGVGSNVATRVLELSGDLGFGRVDVGSSSLKSFTVTNKGNTDLTISEVEAMGDFSVSFLNPVLLKSGSSTIISVTYLPNTMGNYSSEIIVKTIEQTTGHNTISATGFGVLRRVALLGNLDFQTPINTAESKKVVVSNTGNDLLRINRISVPNGYSATPQNLTLQPRESQDIQVTFSPTDVHTIYAGKLMVHSDAIGDNSLEIRGVGTISGYTAQDWPFKDIKVEVFSESCPLNNDGQIAVFNGTSTSIELQLSGRDKYLLSAGGSYRHKELESGHYKLYVSSGSLRKELGLVITEPSSDPIQVSTLPVDGLTKSFNLAITGGQSPYTVKVGEKRYSVSGQQLQISDLPLGKHHVEVTDSSGCSLGYSGEIFVAGALKYYPNPVQDFLTVMLPEGIPLGENYTVRIMNSGGQVVSTEVISQSEGHLRISFQDKARGVYLVAIFDVAGTRVGETMKIVVK